MEKFLDMIVNVIVIVTAATPVLLPMMQFFKLKAKNERLILAMTFAEQVVESIGAANRYLPEFQREKAIRDLEKRLKDNGMDKYFTRKQTEMILNQAREDLNENMGNDYGNADVKTEGE